MAQHDHVRQRRLDYDFVIWNGLFGPVPLSSSDRFSDELRGTCERCLVGLLPFQYFCEGSEFNSSFSISSNR